MKDALGHFQRVVVVGGPSAVAYATVARWSRAKRALEVVLVAPPSAERDEAVAGLTALDSHVFTVDLDPSDDPIVQVELMSSVYADGHDVDVVVVGVTAPDDTSHEWPEPLPAARLIDLNTRAAVLHGVLAANRMRIQGHGALLLLSGVTARRVGPGGVLHRASVAAADEFYRGLAEAGAHYGVEVLVVRFGWVDPSASRTIRAPLTVQPDEVASALDEGLRNGRRVVWAPAALRLATMADRLIPATAPDALPG